MSSSESITHVAELMFDRLVNGHEWQLWNGTWRQYMSRLQCNVLSSADRPRCPKCSANLLCRAKRAYSASICPRCGKERLIVRYWRDGAYHWAVFLPPPQEPPPCPEPASLIV